MLHQVDDMCDQIKLNVVVCIDSDSDSDSDIVYLTEFTEVVHYMRVAIWLILPGDSLQGSVNDR